MTNTAGGSTGPRIRPFHIDIPQADVDDLQHRLARTRWTDELPPAELADLPMAGPVQPGWQYGVPVSFVRGLVEQWRTNFDWRAVEGRLNAYPHYLTEIDGQDVHFYHVRSAEPGATPLILTHGWPNTSFEYLGLVDALTDPRASWTATG